MLANDKRANRISKPTRIPKSIKTVDDLLAKDDINGMIADLTKLRGKIKDLVIIYTINDTENYAYSISDETLISKATWLLESTKLHMLNVFNDDD